MAIPHPVLDDRSYSQLRDELIRRIPVYTQEWTDHNPADPGITLIELFAFLGENLLYRFNQIPEATRLQFLKLLQISLRPAEAARGFLQITTKSVDGVLVRKGETAAAGDVIFETQTEVMAFPVSTVTVCKTPVDGPNDKTEADLVATMESVRMALADAGVQIANDRIVPKPDEAEAIYYQNATVEPDGTGEPVDFSRTVDGIIWIAVTADGGITRANLSDKASPCLLNLGYVPDLEAPPAECVLPCRGNGDASSAESIEWQISSGRFLDDAQTKPEYRKLRVRGDSTDGLTRQGVVRIELPREADQFGIFPITDHERAGTGELPPVLDDETEAKILFWLRAFRPNQKRGQDVSGFGKVLFVGANCTNLKQCSPAGMEFLGSGNGQPGQSFSLINRPVLPGSLEIQVEVDSGNWQTWSEVSGFYASDEDSHHYVLDAEAGEVRFGNGLQGAVPQIGQRIRAAAYRTGGGSVGNVAAGAISRLDGVAGITVTNPLPAWGGSDAESIETALDRIPGELRRRDRAVTGSDFRELALMTPGADLGRAECLPRFYPPDGQQNVAGVVTVVIWPRHDPQHPNAPLPNRNQLSLTCNWLDARRLVTTELFVIPPTYRKVAVSVGVKVKAGYGIDAVRLWVELVIRQYLSPVPPYGPEGGGWPLGRRVYGPELEAAALQVEGVEYLEGLQTAGLNEDGTSWNPGPVLLKINEVPELDRIIVVEGGPPDVTDLPGPIVPAEIVPLPVYREEC